MKRHYHETDNRSDDAQQAKKIKSRQTENHQPRRSESESRCFNARNFSSYSGNFPFFRKPTEIGCLSLDANRTFYNDARQLRFYKEPDHIHFDLTNGFDSFIQRDPEQAATEYINDILYWIMHNFNKFEICDKETTSLNTDFVCWRGLLTKILTTPFESKDDWWIGVSLFNGTYYLREVETPRKKSEKENMSRRHEEMSYWGYKFEQYMTTDTVDGVADTRRPVDCNEAYCTVVRGRLSGHSLVYSGETDCCIKHPDGRQEYVELKTSREIYKPNQERNFKRFKLIKWWLQSFLPGVPKIIAGFRDDDGIVHRIQTYKTEDIPKLVKGERDMWDAATCFNFCDAFLSHIKKVVTIDDPRRVVLFKWAPRYDITCMWEDTEQYRFLPDWYIDWMNKKMKQSM